MTLETRVTRFVSLRSLCRRSLLPLWIVALCIGVCATSSFAELDFAGVTPVIADGAAGTDEDNPAALAFTLPLVDRKVSDAYDDFRRLCQRKAWEKAFGQLSKLGDDDLESLIGSQEGLYIPLRQRVWLDLAAMDVEGARAYRLFNDAQAKRLLDDADRARQAADPRERKLLRRIYDFYFITAPGDQAADRMGDLAFEAGQFADAARCWGAILDNRADSDIPAVKLHVKRGVALARAGLWNEFQQTLKFVRDRYAGQKLTVAGKSVDAAEYLAEVGKSAPAAVKSSSGGVAVAGSGQHALKLPTSDKPAWQMQFVTPQTQKMMLQIQPQWDGRGNVSSNVPITVADKDRLYGNWYGIVFAVDLASGKLIWHTDRFSQASKMIREMAYRFDVKRCSLIQIGDKLLATGAKMSQLDRSTPSRLTLLDAESGKVLWSSESTQPQGNFAGRPMVVGDTIYTVMRGQENQTWSLAALNLADGNLRWSIPIGTPVSGGPNYNGDPTALDPVLGHHDGMVYVHTNCGVMLAVSVAEKRLLWAVGLDVPGPDAQARRLRMMSRYGGQMVVSSGTLLIDGGTAFIKDGQGDSLYAMDLSKPRVLWRRPLGSDETIIGLDASTLYVGGRDLGAIDRQTRLLKWSNPLSSGTGDGRAALTPDALFVFTPRGVFQLDSLRGDVQQTFRGADLDSLGGIVIQCGDRLMTISNLSITAYGPPASASVPKPATSTSGPTPIPAPGP